MILHGDCLELMKDIPSGSIDMILCDLPYGTTACKWDTIIPFDKLWEQYERVIKKNSAIVLTASQPFTSALVMSNLKLFKHEWIWEKTRAANFANAKNSPLKKHESVLIFSTGTGFYQPQKIQGEPYNKRVNTQRKPNGIYSGAGLHSQGLSEIRYDRYPSTVLKFGSMRQQDLLHPTQKPVALFEYLIKTYSNEGDIVLDNCAGSGTTGIACLNTNRNYILMEKEEKYLDIIKNRISEAKHNLFVTK